MKTLTIGCIKANTQRSLALDSVGSSSSSAGTSSAAVHTAETDATIIAHRLRLCVGVINKIRIHVYEAIALDISSKLGAMSKYELVHNVPATTMATRRTPADSPYDREGASCTTGV